MLLYIAFVVVYLFGYWLFKKYRGRWVFWIVSFIVLSFAFGAGDLARSGKAMGVFFDLLVIVTVLRWVITGIQKYLSRTR